MTITFRKVDGFAEMSSEPAQNILHELTLICEAGGVKLSGIGNHALENASDLQAKYTLLKSSRQLFNILQIQRICGIIDICFRESQQMRGHTKFKEIVESRLEEKIGNGDLTAAMLLRGFRVNFGNPPTAHCSFYATIVGGSQTLGPL